MSDSRDIVEEFITGGADALGGLVPDSLIPAVLARLAPLVARAVEAGVPTADRVVVTDHRGTRLAAESPDMHRAQVAALGSK